jgi:uncharacterized membrane protein required for colicin V production
VVLAVLGVLTGVLTGVLVVHMVAAVMDQTLVFLQQVAVAQFV